jgi:hypothetical protein
VGNHLLEISLINFIRIRLTVEFLMWDDGLLLVLAKIIEFMP